MKLLWQQIANTTVTEILCDTAMDGIVLDCEHGYFNNETLVDCIRIIRLRKSMPFVRMKYNEQLIQLCVDNGCMGIIYSNVIVPQDIKYGLGLVVNNFWGNNGVLRNDILHIAQIESVAAIHHLSVGSFIKDIRHQYDFYMIGHYDLSVDCRCPGDFKNDMFRSQIKKFEESTHKSLRGVHIVKNFEDYEQYKDYGLIAFSLDTLSLINGVKELNKYV